MACLCGCGCRLMYICHGSNLVVVTAYCVCCILLQVDLFLCIKALQALSLTLVGTAEFVCPHLLSLTHSILCPSLFPLLSCPSHLHSSSAPPPFHSSPVPPLYTPPLLLPLSTPPLPFPLALLPCLSPFPLLPCPSLLPLLPLCSSQISVSPRSASSPSSMEMTCT